MLPSNHILIDRSSNKALPVLAMRNVVLIPHGDNEFE